MLFFLDGRVGFDKKEPASAALYDAQREFLLLPVGGDSVSCGWLASQNDQGRPLKDWLEVFRRPGEKGEPPRLQIKPFQNHVFLVWQQPDDRLCDLLSLLTQTEDFLYVVSILFTGPLKDDFKLPDRLRAYVEKSTVGQGIHLHRLWFLGNQGMMTQDISEGDRLAAAVALLKALWAGGNGVLERLNLVPMASTPLENLPRSSIFATYGLKSWEPARSRIDNGRLRVLSGLCLIDCINKHKDRVPDLEKSLSSEASSMFDKLRILDTPYAEDATRTLNDIPPRIKHPQSTFKNWGCPLIRSAAMDKGHQEIELNSREALAYYKILCKELPQLARDIRVHGQQVFTAARAANHKFICEAPSLLRMTELLSVYFPLVKDRRSQAKQTPCEPASAPGMPMCKQWFEKDPKEILKEGSARLPTWIHALGVSMISLALFLVAWEWMLLKPAIVALAISGVLLGWAVYWSLRLRRLLHTSFELKLAELRGSFKEKLEWVLSKTQLALENQATGDITAIGGRLKLNRDIFFSRCVQVSKQDAATELEQLLKESGIVGDVAAKFQGYIDEAVKELVVDAAQNTTLSGAGAIAQRLTDQVVVNLNRVIPPPEIDAEIVRRELMGLSKDRFAPALMARLSQADISQGVQFRVFLIPRSLGLWNAELEKDGKALSIETRSSQWSEGHPVMINVQESMTEEDVRRALRVTGFK